MIRSACSMIVLACLGIHAGSAWAQPSSGLSQQELNEGWIALFDGETLYGWKAMSDANWRVAEGAIVVDRGEKGLLRTTTQFGDFVLRAEFQAPQDSNSGIFLHTSPRPTDPAVDCYELNIAAVGVSPFPTGSLVGRAKATYDATPPWREGWRQVEVRVAEGKIQITLDGQQVLAYQDPRPLGRGFIGLQLNEGEVRFRNIKLKPLGLKSLFNGEDLSGWRSHPESGSKFSVTEEGHLNVKDGRGMLETEQKFGDFVLQLECISHGEGLNSGVFFRCIPGDFMNGYEAQISNATVEGDPRRPADCGTGGIFRRKDARFVAADDFEWFPMTIIAEGPHIATWVSGVQVCDWTDQRKPNANPRRGLRLEAGTIQIQGHDPTTDLSFRDLEAGEIPQRQR